MSELRKKLAGAKEDGPKRMPYGKHKGKWIEDLPNDYLEWAAESFSDDYFATLCDQEYQWRTKYGIVVAEDE
jgi:hypothetical protein